MSIYGNMCVLITTVSVSLFKVYIELLPVDQDDNPRMRRIIKLAVRCKFREGVTFFMFDVLMNERY